MPSAPGSTLGENPPALSSLAGMVPLSKGSQGPRESWTDGRGDRHGRGADAEPPRPKVEAARDGDSRPSTPGAGPAGSDAALERSPRGPGGSGSVSMKVSGAAKGSAQVQADYHHSRGYAFRKQNNFRAAVEEYTRALQANPRHFKALFNRAFSYDKLAEYQRAVSGGVGDGDSHRMPAWPWP